MFEGSIVALVTPMVGSGQIDFDALGSLVDFHLTHGTSGLVVSGTTGEAATLSSEELRQLWVEVVGLVAGRVPVIAGTGTYSTADSIERTRAAQSAGVDGALLVTPYYNKPTQAGLVAHFSAVEAASDLPLLLYNVPGRTAVDMLPETVEQLAKMEAIVAIKEAVPDPQRVAELVRRCGNSLVVLSGDDATSFASVREGARGVISVTANVAPAQMARLMEDALTGNHERAYGADQSLQTLHEALMVQSNPIPVKWALQRMGLIGSGIRLPLTPLEERFHSRVEAGLALAGLLDD